MDDIEDLGAVATADPRPARAAAVRRGVKPSSAPPPPSCADDCGPTSSEPIPGTQSLYVKTYGCSHNHSDSEYMCGLLQQYGYRLLGAAEREAADLWLINSCTVKNPSQEHLLTDVRRGRALGVPVVVAGCVSQGEPDAPELAGLSIVGVQQIDRVVEVVQEALRGHTVRLLERRARPSLDLPKVRRNRLVEIVPINTGCLGSCTYCKTVHARGRLGSYEPDALVARLRSAIGDGVREVWITSEDTGAYGRDLTPRCSLPELMTRMLDAMPDGTMLRVGMTNPPYILQHLEALAGILNHPRCYAFLHVPVQSGSDAVLGAMRREYNDAEFCTVADTLRARVPGLTIATDIICGFPGESEADHQATLALVRKYRFPILNISQFYPRPGTPAARMKRTPTHVAKERTREVSALFKSYEPYAHMKGEEYDVLATDIAADGKHLVAHDKSYAQVLLPLRRELLGRSLRVRVAEVAKFYVRAEILDDGGAVADAVEQAAVATLSEAASAAAAAAAVGGAPDACSGGDCEGGDCGGGDCEGGECGTGGGGGCAQCGLEDGACQPPPALAVARTWEASWLLAVAAACSCALLAAATVARPSRLKV